MTGTQAGIPVVLCAYARPGHLRRTLECLKANDVRLIYAFSDGPRTPDVQPKVEEVRRILNDIDWCDITLTEHRENLGLGRSIRAAVTDVLARHESVIVFEDDVVCVEGTYAYLTAALEHYKTDPRVMSVTGWTHPRITPADVDEQPYFDGRAECLVWGTWRRAWRGMDEDAITLVGRCEQQGIDPFTYGADLVDMAAIEHTRNIWAVRFLYLHMLNGGLCLRPPHSLVEHLESGAEATNAGGFAEQWGNPPLQPCPPTPLRWPEAIEHPHCRALAARAYGSRPAPPPLSERLRSTIRTALPVSVLRAYRHWRTM